MTLKTRIPSTRNEVMAIGNWRNNAELIVDVAKLGYLDGTVLDVTYGRGSFWKLHRPEHLVTSDLHTPADHRWDYRRLPLRDNTFDVVVFDPPYKLAGTPTLDDSDRRYGNTRRVNIKERLTDICEGAIECARVAAQHLLVKCQDQVASKRICWQTDLITRVLENIGCVKIDRFDLVRVPRPQPGSRKQTAARRNYSTLLVFDTRRSNSYRNNQSTQTRCS